MKQEKPSWLNGPSIPSEFGDGSPQQWPGQNLGLPPRGAGALASIMRRCGGLTLDWIISLSIASVICNFTTALGGKSTVTLLVYIVIGIVSVALFARTPGQAMMRMGVGRVDDPNARVGLWRAAFRTILTVFLFPPVIVDEDGRGLHDRATNTAVVLG